MSIGISPLMVVVHIVNSLAIFIQTRGCTRTCCSVAEKKMILHPIFGSGEPFKLLGCLIDCKLIMNQTIDKILTQVRPKVIIILRTRGYYNITELIDQFKTHVWDLMEVQNGVIFHASDYLLSKLDRIHANFLMELGVEQSDAFMNFNFAPPDLRRNIGILGMIHKRVLGRCHPVFQKLLPFKSEMDGEHAVGAHDKQLWNHFNEMHFQHILYSKSIFDAVTV